MRISDWSSDVCSSDLRITPDARAGDFAQAMMDLGATICTARNPLCALCPLSDDCAGRSDPAAFPVKPAKKARPERQGYVWWMQNGPDVDRKSKSLKSSH